MSERGNRKELTGTVVSNAMTKTIVVKVTRRIKHRMYKKYFNKSKKYKVHDEDNQCSVGDLVAIRETRPISKEKRWRLHEIKRKAKI